MERLTRRSANGTGVYATPSGEPVKWENNYHNVLQKLADYEDLEEQGFLLRLPCKLGDTIYSIANDGKIYPVKATREVRIVNGVLHIICESCRYSDLVSYDDIGKTVFLTKSEAEAKLKELRGREIGQPTQPTHRMN